MFSLLLFHLMLSTFTLFFVDKYILYILFFMFFLLCWLDFEIQKLKKFVIFWKHINYL